MTTYQQLRSLDQLVDIKDKPALLKQLQSNSTRISTLLNDNSENILHISNYHELLINVLFSRIRKEFEEFSVYFW